MAWAPDYVTPSEAKDYLRIPDDVDDTEIGFAITAASRAIDRATGRQFGVVAAAEERFYTPYWDRDLEVYAVDIDDLQTTTDLAVEDENAETLAALVTLGDGGYRLEPRNALQIGRAWTRLVTTTCGTGDWAVTAIWGWTAVPDTIKQAVLMQVNRLIKRREAPFGVAGSPEGGELRLLAKLDPDVEVLVGTYKRWGAAS